MTAFPFDLSRLSALYWVKTADVFNISKSNNAGRLCDCQRTFSYATLCLTSLPLTFFKRQQKQKLLQICQIMPSHLLYLQHTVNDKRLLINRPVSFSVEFLIKANNIAYMSCVKHHGVIAYREYLLCKCKVSHLSACSLHIAFPKCLLSICCSICRGVQDTTETQPRLHGHIDYLK